MALANGEMRMFYSPPAVLPQGMSVEYGVKPVGGEFHEMMRDFNLFVSENKYPFKFYKGTDGTHYLSWFRINGQPDAQQAPVSIPVAVVPERPRDWTQ